MYFTSQQLFGNGAGVPGGAGWVPIDLAAPPTYSANNRGIAFGEQLTSAIANRPHYALALNDDDLNTRLASFEVGGLDAAYDLGTIGPDGGGRIITKDGGAVETQSLLVAAYGDDEANAHFRARQTADVVSGGIGFESVSYGRTPGVGFAQYGFLDRRALNINNFSIITDTVTATLNQGGIQPSGLTVSGGAQFKDGSDNTDLLQGVDLIEVLSGPTAGLYFINAFTSSTAATLVQLDGTTAPVFAGNEATTIRVYRPIFGSQQGNTFLWGRPKTSASLEIFGNTLGRFDTLASSTDGPRYSLRHFWKTTLGAAQSTFHIDGHGQLSSTVSSAQLTATQIAAGTGFGAPAYVVQQDGGSADYELGFLARSNDAGTLGTWMGVVAAGQANPATTPTGIFAFNFINIPPYNVDLTDTTAADWMLSPTVTFIEILTPSPQAGIYRVDLRDVNNGRLSITDLEGNAIVFPTSGAGTLRIFVTQSFGARDIDTRSSLWSGSTTLTRAGALLQSPKEVGGAALVLEAGHQNATPTDYWLIRGIRSEDGFTDEVFCVDSRGRIAGSTMQSSDEYTYKNTKTYRHTFVAATSLYQTTFTGGGYTISSSDPEFFLFFGTGDMAIKSGGETAGQFGAIYPAHLPQGCIVTKIGIWYSSLNGTVGTEDVRYTLCSKAIGSGVLSMKTGSPSYFSLTIDNANHITADATTVFPLTETTLNRTVNNDMASGGREWFLWIGRPTTADGDHDVLYYSLWIEYTLTTVAGA